MNLTFAMQYLHRFTTSFTVLFVAVVIQSADAQQLVRVPQDQPTLQAAIGAVADGGVIEMAAGTYQAPSGGFTMYDVPKGFTVRAAAGATVVLSGGGTNDILRFANSSFSAARPVHFEGLTFADAVSTTPFIGGAITLGVAEATFKNCVFRNNAANSPGPGTGGGALWISGSVVFFDSCTFTNNTSPNFGAGMSVLNSRVFVHNSRFTGNRTDEPGHSNNSSGGAIFVNDATLRVTNSTFENNRAGYVGGAIYVIGLWKDPVSTPAADIVIRDSVFTANAAQRATAVNFTAPAVGGAVHFEGQTTAKVLNCRFFDNTAPQGGAFSNYLAITEIEGCVFKGNRAIGNGNDEGQGGAIIALSAEAGPTNHRPSQLLITDTLIQGTGGTTPTARQGGCIFAGGDSNFAYGQGGVQPNGTPQENRGVVKLTRVALVDGSVVGDSSLPGTGGAFLGAFVDLTIDESTIQNCTATASGGGLQLIQGSVASVADTIISECASGAQGAAITLFGSTLNMTGSEIVESKVTPNPDGGAFVSAPTPAADGFPAFDADGLIQNCVFSNNSGSVTIYDGDRGTPPFNRIRYMLNDFSPDGPEVYFNDAYGAKDVAGLNAFTIQRSDGTTTIKGNSNTAASSAPVVGRILQIPATPPSSGGPGESLPPAYVVFASSGGPATVDGAPQPTGSGVIETTDSGVHTLKVGSEEFSTSPPPGSALNISTRLPVGQGQDVLIGGFIIQGPAPKRVLIRALGPSLAANGVQGALLDPRVALFDSSGTNIGNNDNWRSTQAGGVIPSNQAIDIEASTIAPTNNAEAAMLVELPAGAYTAVVSGVSGGTGVALIEVYDLDGTATSTLANISTRGFIQTGDNVMIGGFIFGGGTGATKVLVRGIGPSLAAGGVENPLADPTLELFNGNGDSVAVNDNWQDTQKSEIEATGLQPTNAAEATILMINPPRGPYTAAVRGKNGTVGVGVVEAYIF